jgi:hypothetical protein
MKTIPESIRDWIENQAPASDTLDGITVHIGGETNDLEPPFIAVFETGSEPFEQNDATLYGVSTYEITVELHTLPTSDGTTATNEALMREALFDILEDRDLLFPWIENRNSWRIFDIRLPSPITVSEDGVRVSRFALTVIACPI